MDGLEEAHVGVAQIGHGIEGNIRHGFAEGDVEYQQVVQRAIPVAQGMGDGFRAVQHLARAGQGDVERNIALADGARRAVDQGLPETEILEKIAGAGLVHGFSSASIFSIIS